MLEAQGFRVGIIAQPDWHSAEPFKALGKPNLFFGVTAGNMDSMINRYTADRKIRSDDAYTPGDVGGKRPDRAGIVYSQRCREAFKDVPIVLGGIEGSLRRIAHYDYWSDKVRRSILVDAKCDLLLYGNAERAIVEIAHRLAAKEPVQDITDVRGTAFFRRTTPEGWFQIDSTSVDTLGRVEDHINPYQTTQEQAQSQGTTCSKEDGNSLPLPPGEGRGEGSAGQPMIFVPNPSLAARSPHPNPPPEGEGARKRPPPRDRTVIRLPSYEQVKSDPVAVRPRLPRAAPRDQPRQRPRAGAGAWRARRVAEAAADPADHGRDGPCVRPALRARAASQLRRREWPPRRRDQDPGVGNDPLLDQHHARLLRRLHLLLDHRARGPHHPEPLARTR